MLMAFMALVVFGPTVPRLVVFVVALAYVGVSLTALRSKVWALLVSIGVAAMLLARWLPMVIINFRMYLDDHPLYVDSPATILIVGINALLFVVPATLLLLFYLIQWRKVVSFVRQPSPGA
jgi:hypothetical protein